MASWRDKAEPVQQATPAWRSKAEPVQAPAADSLPPDTVRNQAPVRPSAPPAAAGPDWNPARNMGARGADLFGNLFSGVGTLMERGEEYLTDRTGINPGAAFGSVGEMQAKGYEPDLSLGGYGVDFRSRMDPKATNAGEQLREIGGGIADEDFGYQPNYTIDRALDDPSVRTIAGAVGEQGPAALADMAALFVNAPAYLTSRTEEIGQQRAKNDGREGTMPTGEDIAYAAPGAAASVALDKMALGRLLPGATPRVSSMRQVPGAVLRGGATEAGTEAVQEGGIEYAAESVNTEAGWDPTKALRRAAGGALIGGPIGGGVRGITSVAEARAAVRADAEANGVDPNTVTDEQADLAIQRALDISAEQQLTPEELDTVIRERTGQDAQPALDRTKPEGRQRARQTEQELGDLFRTATDINRRGDVEVAEDGPTLRDGARPAQDPTGEQANPETFAVRQRAVQALEDAGLEVTPESIRRITPYIEQDTDVASVVNAFGRGRRGGDMRNVPDLREELGRERTKQYAEPAFRVADSRRQRMDGDVDAGGPQGAASDYRAAAIPEERQSQREVTLLDAQTGRDGRLTGGEAVEVIAEGKARNERGQVVDAVRIRVGDNDPEWVEAGRVSTVQTPENPRLAQQARAETRTPPAGVGTVEGDAPAGYEGTSQTPQPRRATDRIADPDGLRRGEFIPGDRGDTGPQGGSRQGGTYESGVQAPQVAGPRTGPQNPNQLPRLGPDPEPTAQGQPEVTEADMNPTPQEVGGVDPVQTREGQAAPRPLPNPDEYGVSQGSTGIHLDSGYTLNLDGDFVPSGDIVLAGGRSTDLSQRAFNPRDPATKQQAVSLVTRIEESRKNGDMDTVGRLEEDLAEMVKDEAFAAMGLPPRKKAGRRTAPEQQTQAAPEQQTQAAPVRATAVQREEIGMVFPGMVEDGSVRVENNQIVAEDPEYVAEAIENTYNGNTGIDTNPARRRSMLSLAEKLRASAPDTAVTTNAGAGQQAQPAQAAPQQVPARENQNTVPDDDSVQDPKAVKRAAVQAVDDVLAQHKAGRPPEGDTVAIPVPGGPTYTVRNTPDRLREFRKNVQNRATAMPAEARDAPYTTVASASKDAAVKNFLEDGEVDNAIAYAETQGMDVVYGEGQANDGSPLAHAYIGGPAPANKVGGIDGLYAAQGTTWNNPRAKDNKYPTDWVVIDPKSGRTLGHGGSKTSAMKAAKEAVERAGVDRTRDVMKNAAEDNKQDTLRKRWGQRGGTEAGAPAQADTNPASQRDASEGQGGGTLYSGIPLDKITEAIRKVFGGEREAAKFQAEKMGRLLEDAREISGGATGKGRTTKRSILTDAWRTVFATTDGNMRALVKNFDSPTLRSIPDMFHAVSGRSDGVGQTYDESIQARNKRFQEIDEITSFMRDNDLTNRERQRQLIRLVENPRAPRRGKIGEAAKRIDQFFKDELAYLRDAGVEVGDVSDGYVPRVMDSGKAYTNRDEFITQTIKAYQTMGQDRETAAASAEAYWDTVVYGVSGKPGWTPRGGQTPSFVKGRVFTKEAAKHLEAFRVQDVDTLLSNYSMSASRRAEIARRFGDNWSRWEEIEQKITDEDPDAAAILPQLRDLVAVSAGIQLSDMSGRAQAALSWGRTFTTLALLEKAAISSLGELVIAPIRGSTGNIPGDVAVTMANLMAHTGNTLRWATGMGRSKKLETMFELAEDIGIIAGTGHNSLMAARFAGGDPVGRLQSEALSSFFRRNGLEYLTNYTRVTSMHYGQVFMRRLAKQAEKNPTKVGSYLRELGIPKGREVEFARWVRENNDGMPGIAETRTGEMGQMYRTGLQRFADQTVMRPNNSTRPKWANTPIGGLVFQLMNFVYSFQKNVINRYPRKLLESDLTAVEKLAFSASSIAGLSLLIGLQGTARYWRDEVFNEDINDRKTDAAFVEGAVSQAGLLGVADPFLQALTGVRYQKPLLASFTGPGVGGASDLTTYTAAALVNNSDETNTAERNAAKVWYEWVLEPVMQGALTFAPGGPVSGKIASAATVGAIPGGRDMFVDTVAGKDESTRSKSEIKSSVEWLFGVDEETGGRSSGRSTGRSAGRESGRDAGR